MASAVRSVVLILGIYVFFLGMGIFQERVFTYRTPDTNERFTFTVVIVFLMCLGSTALSAAVVVARDGLQNTVKSFATTPSFVYSESFLCSISYVMANLATNYALHHVAYPTQVMVKSIKMVPVTVGGFIFYGKRYPWYDYVAVAVITTSLMIFNLVKKSSKSTEQTWLGMVSLFVALGCDSMTGPRQDNLLARAPSLEPVKMMFLTNCFGLVSSGIATLLLEGGAAFVFIWRVPAIMQALMGLLFFSACGQIFIFYTLKEFGSLYLTVITTTRKFFTVLLSVVLFGHAVSPLQWLCVAGVFCSLGLQSVKSKIEKNQRQ